MAVYKRPGIYISESLLPAPVVSIGTAQAAGAVAGTFPQGPSTVQYITSWYQFTNTYGGYNAAYPATFQVAQFFANGGKELYVKRFVSSDATSAAVTIPRASGSNTVGQVTALNKGADGNNLRVQLTAGNAGANYYDLTVYKEGVAGTASDVTNDTVLEVFSNIRFDSTTSADYVVTVVNTASQTISISVTDNVNSPSVSVLPLTGGTDGSGVTAYNYTDSTTGVAPSFAPFNRPLVIFLPGLYDAFGSSGANSTYAAVASVLSSTQFLVADTDPGLSAASAITQAGTYGAYSNVAVYYPRVYISDPTARSSSALRLISPAGAVVGQYMNTDTAYGPFKAPAGLNVKLSGVVALEKTLTSAELDALNSASSPVNAIRQVPGAGISIMGARTLKQDGTANMYVNMRRSLIFLRQTLDNLTEFALFENNDENLWNKINTVISSALNDYRNAGGLRGRTQSEAFFVKCDAENNTATTIAQGQVNIQVGVALQYPAEFVIITLSQKTIS
jgi:uncharacterized protein